MATGAAACVLFRSANPSQVVAQNPRTVALLETWSTGVIKITPAHAGVAPVLKTVR